MADRGKKPIVAGLTLIALGIAFSLNNIFHFGFLWQLILIFVGGAFLYHAIADNRRSVSFPGFLLIFLGLIFLADDLMWLPWGLNRDWPLFLIAVGASFVFSYLLQMDRKGLLIPGGILLVLGGIFMAAEYHYWSWHDVGDILEWWPILFLVFGLYMIFQKNDSKTVIGEEEMKPATEPKADEPKSE